MTGLTVEQRDELAELLASSTVPWLTYAVHMRNPRMVADMLLSLDRQELLALAVVLAARCPHPLVRPDDGVIDEVAVERACAGGLVPLSRAERVEAVRILRGRGCGPRETARLLNINGSTTQRLIARVDAEQGAA